MGFHPLLGPKMVHPTLSWCLGLGDESPSMPRIFCWFSSFFSNSASTCLALLRARFPCARGTESCSRGHPQPQRRVQSGQWLLGCASWQTQVPQPKQRGRSKGKSPVLGQRSRVSLVYLCHQHPLGAAGRVVGLFACGHLAGQVGHGYVTARGLWELTGFFGYSRICPAGWRGQPLLRTSGDS